MKVAELNSNRNGARLLGAHPYSHDLGWIQIFRFEDSKGLISVYVSPSPLGVYASVRTVYDTQQPSLSDHQSIVEMRGPFGFKEEYFLPADPFKIARIISEIVGDGRPRQSALRIEDLIRLLTI